MKEMRPKVSTVRPLHEESGNEKMLRQYSRTLKSLCRLRDDASQFDQLNIAMLKALDVAVKEANDSLNSGIEGYFLELKDGGDSVGNSIQIIAGLLN